MLVEVDRGRLHVEMTGDGPVVAFSHGVLMDSSMWHRQVEALSADHTCVTWDERGHGDTVSDGEPFTYWDSARDLLAVVAEVDRGPAVLVGHSQGGFLSLRAALLAPEQVRGLVLVPSHGTGLDAGTIATFEGIRDAWIEHGSDAVADGLLGFLVGPPELHEHWRTRWARLDRGEIGNVVDVLIGLDDLGDRLTEIAVPALVLHGSADPAMPPDLGRQLAARLGGPTEFRLVDGAGHAPALTHPDAVTAALRGFLEKL